MNLLRLNLGNLEPGHVKHIHHFHKLVWVTVSLSIIALLLAYGWINCHNEKNVLEANDIKYRYWKADNNASLLKLTYYTDSLYDLDEGDFINHVVQAEHEIAEQKLLYRLAGEKEKQPENLKKAKKSSSK